MNHKFAVMLALLVCAAPALLIGVAGASHYDYFAEEAPGPADSWEHEDLYLGEDDSYDNQQLNWNDGESYSGGLEHYGVDWDETFYLYHIFSASPYLDMSECGATNAEAFGIDRGNDDDGTETDESLLNAYKNFVPTKHSVRADFWRESQLAGEPVELKAEDQVVARLNNCYGTPDEEGWYRIWAYANGSTTQGGEPNVEWGDFGRWMYVCDDCENRQEAIDKLGGPPSDDASNGFRVLPDELDDGESSGGDDGETATPTIADSEGTPTATEGDPDSNDTPTADNNNDQDSNDTPTADNTNNDQDSNDTPTADNNNDGNEGAGDDSAETPASGDGPGFGVTAALGALLAVALLVTRRRTR
jgi:PGF-CTERM protein